MTHKQVSLAPQPLRIPADAEACPKCGGLTGWHGQEVRITKVIGAWGGTPEHQDTVSADIDYVRCDDCSGVFAAPEGHNQGGV